MMPWMARATLAAALLALAATAVEAALPARGRTRWIWAAATLVAASLPWLGGLLAWAPDIVPWERFAGPVGPGAAALSVDRVAGGGATSSGAAIDYVATAWALASAALLILLACSAARLDRAMRSGAAARLAGVAVRLTPDLGPAVVGVLRPRIAVPRWLLALSPKEIGLALAHEREHVRAGDTRLLAGAAAICTAMPWNLPLWWMARRLARAVELDCDARVLAVHDPAAYGRLLLRVADRTGAPRPAVLALAGTRNHLEQRIVAMSGPPKRFRTLLAVPLLAAGIGGVVLACDAAEDPTAPADALATQPAADAVAPPTVPGRAAEPELLLHLRPVFERAFGDGPVAGVLTDVAAQARVEGTLRQKKASLDPQSGLELHAYRAPAGEAPNAWTGDGAAAGEAHAMARFRVEATGLKLRQERVEAAQREENSFVIKRVAEPRP